MKKLFLTFLLAVSSISSFAQAEWTCQTLTDDIAKWKELKAPFEGKNKKAAEALKVSFGLNSSGKLSADYVITCTDSIGEERIMNAVEAWLAEVFPNANNSLLASNKTSNSVVIRGMSLGKVGEAADIFSNNTISATFEIEVYAKANRVRVIMRSNQYTIVKTIDGKVVENYTTAMDSAYPFDPKSAHKDSYAMAYINTYEQFFSTTEWLVNYLNQNVQGAQGASSIGDDW